MIYSQFLFMILRLIVLYLGLNLLIPQNVFGASVSLLYTFDTLFAIAIYVMPKCIQAKRDPEKYNPRSSMMVSRYSSGARRSFISGHSDHNHRSSLSDHGRRPVLLQTASMDVNFESDATVSNLRGRQPRRTPSFDRPVSCEVSSSKHNDSLIDEELSASINNESSHDVSENKYDVIEDIPSDLHHEASSSDIETKSPTARNRTPPRTNNSSHDSLTEGENKELLSNLQLRTDGDNEEGTTTLKSNPLEANQTIENETDAEIQPHGAVMNSHKTVSQQSQIVSPSLYSDTGKEIESPKPTIQNEKNVKTPDKSKINNEQNTEGPKTKNREGNEGKITRRDKGAESLSPKMKNERDIATTIISKEQGYGPKITTTNGDTGSPKSKIKNERNITAAEKEKSVTKPNEPMLWFTTSSSSFPLIEKRKLKGKHKANSEATLATTETKGD
mmetsp:Transcript_3105/g.8420  ORF Transcript_3105/g.8420 Transcript_3105/m.8420 type:complete len:445 (-) Transcript_3105:229-1563(-)